MRKSWLSWLLVFCGLGVCLAPAMAQDHVSGAAYNWSAVTTTGQVGSYLMLDWSSAVPPRSFVIDWTVTGTAPSACTLRVEGSSDNVYWYGLDVTSPATEALPCTASGHLAFVDHTARYLRVNAVTYTAGSSTTLVVFHYTAAY